MNEQYIAHHGILGQKWGVRRFQNEDGTRTAAGKKRYSSGDFVPSETKIPAGAIQERPRTFKPKTYQDDKETVKKVADKINEARKEHAVNTAMKTAKNEQEYWEKQANATEKYIKQLESGELDSDFSSKREVKNEIKTETAELKRMQQNAKDWMDTQESLKKMKISDMSVGEVKKKTSKIGMINGQSK